MANFFISTNMSLVIPVPTVDPGPDWAQNLNASLTIIDSHTHSPGSGVQITPTGININADLSFNTLNNATNLRSVRFFPNPSVLALATDIGCLYESGVDLYYNDGAGNNVRITQSGSVTGSAGTITGLPSGTASASYQSGSGTFRFLQATNTGANIDVASVIVRYPGSYPAPTGNFIILEAPSSLSSGYALTLPALPPQTNVMTLGTTGIISSVTWDQVGVNMTSTGADSIGTKIGTTGANHIGSVMGATGANAIGIAMTASGANAVANSRTRAVGNPVAAGDVAVTSSCGTFTSGSSGFVTITNLVAQITTTGRPVMIFTVPSPQAFIQVDTSTVVFQILGTTFTTPQWVVDRPFTAPQEFPPPIVFLDAPGAGVQTYTLQVATSGGIVTVNDLALIVYEI